MLCRQVHMASEMQVFFLRNSTKMNFFRNSIEITYITFRCRKHTLSIQLKKLITTSNMQRRNQYIFNSKQTHTKSLQQTEDHEMTKKGVYDHNRRINIIQDWLRIEYSSYYNIICKPITAEQKEDPKFLNLVKDFDYPNLDPQVIKTFISSNKVKEVKPDGKEIMKSFVDLRKYSDCIKHGARRAKTPLSEVYHTVMKTFLDTLKKENTKQKGKGLVHEKEADPISFPFLRAICKYAISIGWIQVWTWTVLQWHCMARSNNIGKLNFGSFKAGTDSILIIFDCTKSDQTGDKISPKNCYSNPFNFHLCVTTALGSYLSIHDEDFSKGRQTIFRSENASDENSASHGYCESLVKLLKKMGDSIQTWVRPGHANGHGIRKGASIAVTSASTCPPPPSSVARRGEWSLGKVFDIYWQWAEAGDQYCGRILAGLDPMSHHFEAIPPHFVEGIDDADVKMGVEMNFKNIYRNAKNDASSNMTAILVRCLASLVHHSDAMLEVIAKNPGHPFMNIPILSSSPALLQRLKNKVTTKRSTAIESPTGVPPHVKQMSMISEVFEFLKKEREERKNLEEKLRNIIESAIEKNAAENGHLTAASMRNVLTLHKKEMENHFNSTVDKKLDTLMTMLSSRAENFGTPSVNPIFQENLQQTNLLREDTIQRGIHYWDGKYWDVPKNFDFPQAKLRMAFTYWIQGIPNFKDSAGNPAAVMPFKHFKCDKGLPQKLHSKLRGSWKPIMKKLLEAPNLPELRNANHLNPDVINTTFDTAFAFLQTQISYVFEKEQYKAYHKWSVSNWSKHIKPSEIRKNGNANDIALLPPQQTRKRKNIKISSP